MKKIIFLFCCIPFLNYAQRSTIERPEKGIVPNPYNAIYYTDKTDYTNIESIITTSKNRGNNSITDTLQVTYYTKGLRTKVINYRDNQRSQTTLMTYNDDQTLNNWEIIYPKYSQQTFYQYDEKQRMKSTRQVKTRPINGQLVTSELSKRAFIYNDFGLLEIHNEGSFQGKEIYEYNNKQQLMKYSGVGIIKEFVCNDDGDLLISTEYMGEIASNKLMTVQKFEYNGDKNLVMDSIVTSSNREKSEFQKTHYIYENNQLEAMKVTFGSLYRNLQFEYLADKIKKITVETNGNSAYLRTWMPYQIPDFYSFPLTYSEVFEYDDIGNKIARRIYVNDELFSETEYFIKYQD
jgi:hypothetical protein